VAALEKISFPSSSSVDWAKMAAQELNDPDPFQKLSSAVGGISVKPYYDGNDVSQAELWNVPSGFESWVNAPKISVLDPKAANQQALTHLNSGADGVLFDLTTKVSVEDLLKEIELPHCHVFFLCDQTTGVPFLESFTAFIAKKKWKRINGSIYWREQVQFPITTIEHFRCGFEIREKENSPEQLSLALLQAVRQLDHLTDAGVSAENALQSISFLWPVKINFFLAVAEMRAMQMLWKLVGEAYGVKNASVFLHASSQAFVKDSFQPHGNLIKQTTSGLAAVLGNCQALTCEPEKEEISMLSRMSRNVSSMLKEESHLAKVSDPAAGAYFIEALSNELAASAWKKFQETV
jgi:methylmalonyl-CoA mutase